MMCLGNFVCYRKQILLLKRKKICYEFACEKKVLFSHFYIIIIILIISIFKEDNVFSITASLPYGPPLIQTLNIIRLFSDLFIFASVAKLVV